MNNICDFETHRCHFPPFAKPWQNCQIVFRAVLGVTVLPYGHLACGLGGRRGEGLLLRALGVSVDATEVRHPVAALWELYKSAPLFERMGKVAAGFKRGDLLRDLPQLSSGIPPSLTTDHQR